MKPLLPGQFFKRIAADESGAVEGWTVLEVVCGGATAGPVADDLPARVCVIRNDTRTARYGWISGTKLAALIDSGEWVETVEPLKPWVELEPEPPEAAQGNLQHGKARVARNARIVADEKQRMAIIQPILDLGRDAFVERIRVSLQKEIAARHGLAPNCVWQYLCLYWQLGLRAKGVRPRHNLAGQKSFAARMAPGPAGPGARTDFRVYKPGRKPSGEVDPGRAMAARDIAFCQRGARKFMFQPAPDHQLRYNWTAAHSETLNLFYDREKNPSNPAPTLRQFKVAVLADPDFAKLSTKIVGGLWMAKDHGQRTNTTRHGLSGPGQLGQLDDVTSKVILVDEAKYLPIGTGRAFVLVDAWSKIIAGAHDTLENSTFAESTECLINAFQPKGPFSDQHGLGLNLKYHPCAGVFKGIMVDNGPLGGDLANVIPEGVCEISNAPGYRPDRKGDVESSFNAFLRQHAEKQPGYNRVERSRGDSDPKVVAYLTPREFRRLLWKWIEMYNRRRIAGWLPLDALKAEDMPDPTPWQLWNWGLKECGGHLRSLTETELRRALLPRGQGTMSATRGINFQGLVYIIEEKDRLACAGLFGSRPVNIRYDSKYVRLIFVEIDGKLIAAYLRADLDADFGHQTFAAVRKLKEMLNARGRAVDRDHDTARGELGALSRDTKRDSMAKAGRAFGNEKRRQAAAGAISIGHNRKRALASELMAHAAKVEASFGQQNGQPAATAGSDAVAPNPNSNQGAADTQPARQLTALEILENN